MNINDIIGDYSKRKVFNLPFQHRDNLVLDNSGKLVLNVNGGAHIGKCLGYNCACNAEEIIAEFVANLINENYEPTWEPWTTKEKPSDNHIVIVALLNGDVTTASYYAMPEEHWVLAETGESIDTFDVFGWMDFPLHPFRMAE